MVAIDWMLNSVGASASLRHRSHVLRGGPVALVFFGVNRANRLPGSFDSVRNGTHVHVIVIGACWYIPTPLSTPEYESGKGPDGSALGWRIVLLHIVKHTKRHRFAGTKCMASSHKVHASLLVATNAIKSFLLLVVMYLLLVIMMLFQSIKVFGCLPSTWCFWGALWCRFASAQAPSWILSRQIVLRSPLGSHGRRTCVYTTRPGGACKGFGWGYIYVPFW